MVMAQCLYYMRARYYNPEVKRFVNRDVVVRNIDDGQTFNRYAYVNGNPISYVDPFGLSRDSDTDWLRAGGNFLVGAGDGAVELWDGFTYALKYDYNALKNFSFKGLYNDARFVIDNPGAIGNTTKNMFVDVYNAEVGKFNDQVVNRDIFSQERYAGQL